MPADTTLLSLAVRSVRSIGGYVDAARKKGLDFGTPAEAFRDGFVEMGQIMQQSDRAIVASSMEPAGSAGNFYPR